MEEKIIEACGYRAIKKAVENGYNPKELTDYIAMVINETERTKENYGIQKTYGD